MDDRFYSLYMLVAECVWADSTTAQRVLKEISNEENQ